MTPSGTGARSLTPPQARNEYFPAWIGSLMVAEFAQTPKELRDKRVDDAIRNSIRAWTDEVIALDCRFPQAKRHLGKVPFGDPREVATRHGKIETMISVRKRKVRTASPPRPPAQRPCLHFPGERILLGFTNRHTDATTTCSRNRGDPGIRSYPPLLGSG
jgi:hypothetical protein